MKIELHVFTNCTEHIEYHQPIFETIKSFNEAFGNIEPHIWFDTAPNKNVSREYLKKLTQQYKNVKISQSFSDGYIRAIKESDCNFLFMLEHDWTFNKEAISHTLDEICNVMSKDSIHHFKFSLKDNNIIPGKDNHWHYPIEFINGELPYHLVQSASNNPHIVNKDLYMKDLINKVKADVGSLGIEQNLVCIDTAKFAVYGGLELKATVNHTDGRLAYKE